MRTWMFLAMWMLILAGCGGPRAVTKTELSVCYTTPLEDVPKISANVPTLKTGVVFSITK